MNKHIAFVGPARAGKTQMIATLYNFTNYRQYIPTQGCRKFKLKLNDGTKMFIFEVGSGVVGLPQIPIAFSDKQLVIFQSLENKPQDIMQSVIHF